MLFVVLGTFLDAFCNFLIIFFEWYNSLRSVQSVFALASDEVPFKLSITLRALASSISSSLIQHILSLSTFSLVSSDWPIRPCFRTNKFSDEQKKAQVFPQTNKKGPPRPRVLGIATDQTL